MKNTENPFQFTVELPEYCIIDNKYYGYMYVRMKAPVWMARYEANRDLNSESQERLIKAELKNAMIESIINGEFIYVRKK